MSNQIKKENLTKVKEAYCYWLTEEVRNEITNFAISHPYDAAATRALIIKAIEPAANTRKKKYFINKLNQIKKPIEMIYYMFNSILKAQETPAYDYSYLYKNK